MHRNGIKTVALLGLVSAGVVVVGAQFGTTGLVVSVVAVVGGTAYVVLRGETIPLRAMRAYPVSEAEQPALHRAVREIAARARVSMPRIYVSPTPAVNAFAAGRSPATAVVCTTEGLLAALDDDELRGVIAHEFAHIRRRDALVATVAGGIATMVMALAGLAFLLPGGEDDDGPGVVGALLLAVLGPVAAGVVAGAVNRSREYEADAAAATITGDPLALARALRKIDASARRLVLPPERAIVAFGHLMIASPLRRQGLARLFASHPPMAERVARLEQRAGYRR